MTLVKRLRPLAVLLGATAAAGVVGSSVLGDAPGRPAPAKAADPVQVATAAARTRFTGTPVLTYQKPGGATAFAWQVRPELPPAQVRPRDILVMIDTSASQAGKSMDKARVILEAIAQDATADDRLDVWTANINSDAATRSLSTGFRTASSPEFKRAQAALATSEYAAGAVDLPAAVTKATRAFERRAGRQQVLVYLGDGESAASARAVTETARVALGAALATSDVQFFAVPIGLSVRAETLHGLAVQTGGAVVRVTATLGEFREQFAKSLAEPVLFAPQAAFGPEGVVTYPTALPPLRGDRPTLVVGTLPASAAKLTLNVSGRVGDAPVTLTLSEAAPAPDAENYFLSALVEQWKSAPAPDAPALLAADRTLAMASEQYRLFRDEFTTQAVWAISADRLDHAEKLFEAALKIDPAAVDALGGLKTVGAIRGGSLKADAAKQLIASGRHLSRLQDPPTDPLPGGGKPVPQPPVPPAAAVPPVLGVPGPLGPTDAPPAPANPNALPSAPPGGTLNSPAEQTALERAINQQTALESQNRIVIDETLRRARRLQSTDPDSAYADLKGQLDAVRNNDQLSAPFRNRLTTDLEAALSDVALRAGEIKRQQAAERERINLVRQRRTELDQQLTQEEQTKARVDAFRQLMQQAKFEYAQQEAQVMTQERVSRGLGVPPATFASYRIGQAATNLREITEIKRIRENNYLLTMLQVEKSFIPYPDEPPVHFPPAAVWRELTAGRKEKYSNVELGPEVSPNFKRLRSIIEGLPGAKRVNLQNLENLSLENLLAQLQDQYKDDGVRFQFRQDRFEADRKPGETKIRTTGNLSGAPLGDFLDTVLRDIGMTYIVRPESIEIGPNNTDFSLRYDEKVTKVFDVGELVVGIPESQSQSALQQNLQFLGQQATIFGSSLVPFNGGVQGGALGGGLGGIGGLGLGGGGLGAGGLGAGGLGLGGGGGGLQGFQGGAQGGAVGLQGGLGGAVGGQAGQMGQLGQLGSAFSIRGNDQSQFLVQLITQTVAQGEWNLRGIGGLNNQQVNQLFDPVALEQQNQETRKLNSLGYYPPARALVVRGSHRYHNTNSFDLLRGAPGGNIGADDAGNPAKPLVAAALKGNLKQDPAKLWDLVVGTALTDPDVIVDAVDELFVEMSEFGHAAEVLKAGLRHGRVNGAWTHEALAIALKQTQASPAEVERASLSGIDLDPTSADCYLKAAKAESDLNQPVAALAFCQRAAELAPNSAEGYADALKYATQGEVRSDSLEWAGRNLLRRDWPMAGADYHAEAKARITSAAARLDRDGKPAEAQRLRDAVAVEKGRDLMIQLVYQGNADLDLVVTEPSGSVCSASRKRTTGGGVLRADQLGQSLDDRSETYTAASAFTGTYTVSVRPVVGKPTGNRVRVRAVRHQGTPQESAEVHSFDVGSQPLSIQLEAGSRTELALVSEPVSESQVLANRATEDAGFAGGFGQTVASAGDLLPALAPVKETRVNGAATGLPGLRLETKVGADRKSLVMSAKPVFTGPARDIKVPAVNLIPGG